MFNVKKLISLTLCLTFIFNIFMPTSTFALDLYDDCSQINDQNVYCRSCYYKCGEIKKDILNSGKDYVIINKHGSVTNDVDRYTSFKDLDRVFDIIKLEPTDPLYEEMNDLDNEEKSYSLNFKNILIIGCNSLAGALGGFFVGRLANKKNMPQQNNAAYNKAYIKRSTLSDIAYLIGAGITGVSSFVYLLVKEKLTSKKYDNVYEKYKKVRKLNKEKFSALNQMLHDLESTDYYSNGTTKDAFLIGNHKKGLTFNSCFLGLDYSDEEKATLPGRLKKLASEIRKNLEEHEMLSDYNKIGDERENQDEAIQSDN